MMSTVMVGAPAVLSWVQLPGEVVRVWTSPNIHQPKGIPSHIYVSGTSGFPSVQILAGWEARAAHDQNFHVQVIPAQWLP